MKKITNLEYNSLIYFLNRACFIELTLSIILNTANQDSPISLIIGTIIGLIPFSIYQYLKNKYPNHNYITLNNILFKHGNIINIIIFIYCLIGLICTFWILVSFTNSLFLFKTNTWIISLALIIPILYASTKEIHIISKISLILFYIVLIFNFIIITGLINKIDISNLKPILNNNKNDILFSSVLFYALSISKLFFINIISKKQIINNNTKTNYITYLLTCINMIIITIENICIFGINLSSIYEYPAFQILKRVNILGVIDRIESILAIEGILSIFIEMIIISYYAKEIIKETFQTKTNKYITTSICLITFFISNIIFKTRENAENFFKGPLLYIIFLICIILPILTLLKTFYNPKIDKQEINSYR